MKYSIEDYLFRTHMKNNYHVQVFIFLCLSYHVNFKNVIKHTAILSIFSYFDESHFPRLGTRPTQAEDMDPWPAAWPNLNHQIGRGQQIWSKS